MSSWTHVLFTAEVTAWKCKSRQELKDQVAQVIAGDWITGSEENAELFVNVPKSHSVAVYSDEFEYYWDTAYISFFGHLRDREKKQTEEEINYLIKRLRDVFPTVRNVSYTVCADGEEYIDRKEEK